MAADFSKNIFESRNGSAVKSTSGGQGIFLVQNGTLRHIPNMDTFYSLQLNIKQLEYFSDDIVDGAPKGPDIPYCTNC